ncbi:MAG TPA: twin-arginine translocase TatA/TatE family subunit [Acidimicrobiales bacterium]|nr:twin-arginine translocase TatA/TatE family subunit [Acidimicrobiales bacterium]
MNLGAPELIIILAVVLLLFGSTRLPKLARSLGQASKEFRHGVNEGGRDEDESGLDDDARSQRTPKTGS